jgi:protoporphyrin/coproporphyrin ferrochelatase
MKTGILLLNFGEPETPTRRGVVAFLERIFLTNARLDPSPDLDTVRTRARAMAEKRASALLEEYRRIGGSPLNRQAARQGEMLQSALDSCGHDVAVMVGSQFTEPGIPAIVERALAAGVDRVIGLPVYPVRGPSTTMAALREMREALERHGWIGPVAEIADWQANPAYASLRADGVRATCARAGVDLDDPGTWIVFAAHGTPLLYLEEGSGYDLDVEDHCRRLASTLGVERYVLGFQNHANRPGVAWTQPDIEHALERLQASRVVVVPVSFMQEHSETLADLDIGLKEKARALGLEFYRVPVPHDDPRFIQVLVDVLLPFLDEG